MNIVYHKDILKDFITASNKGYLFPLYKWGDRVHIIPSDFSNFEIPMNGIIYQVPVCMHSSAMPWRWSGPGGYVYKVEILDFPSIRQYLTAGFRNCSWSGYQNNVLPFHELELIRCCKP